MTPVDESCDERNAMAYLTQAEVGANIARLRDERDVTQDRLATGIGLDPSALSRVESGARGLAVGELVAIADFLGVSLDQLLRDDVVAEPLFRNEGGEAAGTNAVATFNEFIDDFLALEAALRT
jgi:transcriptional regulator with XRE-family HTH domain